MDPPNRNRHPADQDCDGVVPAKNTPMGNGNLGALVDAKRSQTLAFFWGNGGPIDGYDPGCHTAFKSFELHPAALPEQKCNCN